MIPQDLRRTTGTLQRHHQASEQFSIPKIDIFIIGLASLFGARHGIYASSVKKRWCQSFAAELAFYIYSTSLAMLPQEARACNFHWLFNINEGLVLLKLANRVLILINTGPSNVEAVGLGLSRLTLLCRGSPAFDYGSTRHTFSVCQSYFDRFFHSTKF